MRLDDVVLFDFETRSEVDLNEVGGRVYAEHPSTEVVCCCFYAEGEAFTWLPDDPPPPYAPVLAAHNADYFDTHVWRRQGWPEPKRWIDTSAVARTAGLPGKLADLGRRFGFAMKDDTGSAVTKSLSGFQAPATRRDKDTGEAIVLVPELVRAGLRDYHLARKADPHRWPSIPRAVIDCVVAYCHQDVAVMASVWPEIEDFVDLEPDVLEAWRRANDRGVVVDTVLARALLIADAKCAAEATGLPFDAIYDEAFAEALAAEGVRMADPAPAAMRKVLERGYTGRTKALRVPLTSRARELLDARVDVCGLRHGPTFTAWIRGLGVDVPDSQYDTLEPLLKHDNPEVRRFVEARFAVASVASGKLRAMIAHTQADGLMRDNVKYYGAHTGRGAGGGAQLQNFPHPEGEDRGA